MHTLLSHVSLLKHLSPSSLVVKLLAAPDQAKRQIHLPVQAKLPTNRHTFEDRWVGHPPLSVQSKLNANRFWLDKLIHD